MDIITTLYERDGASALPPGAPPPPVGISVAPMDTKMWQIIAVRIFVILLVTTFVGLRAWTQKQRKTLFTADNIVLYVAYIFFLYLAALLTAINLIGLIRPNPVPMSREAITLCLKMGFAIFFTQAIPPMLVKISICLFLVRIFPDNRNLKIAAYTIIGFCCFPQIFIIAAKSIQCKPLSAYWTYGPDSPFCPAYPYKYVLYVAEAFSTATEVAVFILPFPFIWNMTTTRKYRYGLMALFSGGFLSILTDLTNVINSNGGFGNGGVAAFYAQIISTFIPGLPIMVACACTFKPVVDKLRKWIQGVKNLSAGSGKNRNVEQVPTIGRARQNRPQDLHRMDELSTLESMDIKHGDTVSHDSASDTLSESGSPTTPTRS